MLNIVELRSLPGRSLQYRARYAANVLSNYICFLETDGQAKLFACICGAVNKSLEACLCVGN